MNFKSMGNRNLLFYGLFLVGLGICNPSFSQGMYRLPDEYKYDLVRDTVPDPLSFSKDGWYYSVAGVAATKTGLVATYRRSDFHTAVSTDIMVTYSTDGKNWSGHHSIAHGDVWNQKGVWIAPQLTALGDGRLVIICDWGNRTSQQDWPMLSQWQQDNRGMSNHLFWSHDDGKTWTGPHKIDDLGGEPGYITELENGNLIYTRTRSKKTDKLWDAPMPWGDIYYLNESVRSTDGGKTWEPPVIIADDPYFGDCEVGTVNLEGDKLLAITRVGMGGGAFKQPSRFVYSYDGGQSWENPQLSPIYAQRPIVRKLQSGKLLAVYRNRWGTPGTYAFLFDPEEKFSYQPATFVYREETCTLEDGSMVIRTGDGLRNSFVLGFYPAQSPETTVQINAEIKVDRAESNGCVIGAGCWVSIEPDRVYLTLDPDKGFDIDASKWHKYEVIRRDSKLEILVDGKSRLRSSIKGLENRHVQIGNRHVSNFNFDDVEVGANDDWKMDSESHWRSLSVKVDNKEDYDIHWTWDVSKGYPDQFRRDRIVALELIADHFAHTGYPAITQMDDGTIVIADYTVGGNGGEPAEMPFLRSYVVTEEILNRNPK